MTAEDVRAGGAPGAAHDPDPISATDVPAAARAAELLAEGRYAEQLGMLDRAVTAFQAAGRSTEPAIAAEAHTRLADTYRSRAEWHAALEAARRGQEFARRAEDHQRLAHAIIAEANVFMCRGEFGDARRLFDQVLSLTSDPLMRGLALQNVGSILAQQGQLGAAERAFAESYGYFQRAGYRRGEAIALNNYGRVALDRGNLELAEGLLTQALTIAREVEHAELIALATLNLAEAKVGQGGIDRAEDLASQALGFFSACGNRWREIECLRLIGTINERRGCAQDAARCYDRALALANAVGATVEIRTLTDCLSRLGARR